MIYFVAPPLDAFVSGGNLFNRQIITALKASGYPVNLIPLSAVEKFVFDEKDILIMDSFFIKSLQTFDFQSILSNIFLLVHLLPSMIGEGSINIEKRLLPYFSRVIVNSDFSKEYCRKIIGYSGNIRILQPFIEKVQSGDTNVERYRIIMVSTWQPVKQIDLLFKSLAQHDLPKDLVIEIYGDSTLNEQYFQYCVSLLEKWPGLNTHIRIIGKIHHDELLAIYPLALFMIDVSSFESYGMAVAEALAAQVPLITLGNGNIKNLILRGGALVCADIDDLVIKVIDVFNQKIRILSQVGADVPSWSRFMSRVEDTFLT